MAGLLVLGVEAIVEAAEAASVALEEMLVADELAAADMAAESAVEDALTVLDDTPVATQGSVTPVPDVWYDIPLEEAPPFDELYANEFGNEVVQDVGSTSGAMRYVVPALSATGFGTGVYYASKNKAMNKPGFPNPNSNNGEVDRFLESDVGQNNEVVPPVSIPGNYPTFDEIAGGSASDPNFPLSGEPGLGGHPAVFPVPYNGSYLSGVNFHPRMVHHNDVRRRRRRKKRRPRAG